MKIFDPTILSLPFYDDQHRVLARRLEEWVEDVSTIQESSVSRDVETDSRRIARLLGEQGWLAYGVSQTSNGEDRVPDFRSICLIREALAYCDDLFDFIFSIQSLSAAAIVAYGNSQQKADYVPGIREGTMLGTLAISEPEAGSDVAAIRLQAKADGQQFRLTGEKTWISNANIADFHCVLARTGDGSPTFSMNMFLVPAATKNLVVSENIVLTANRSIASLKFDDCVIPVDHMIGKPGYGFRYAMQILERYRPTVGAAAIGFSRRALNAALLRAKERKLGDGVIFDMQMIKQKLADMALHLDAASLLVARSAWELDTGQTAGVARHSSMAKLFSTDGAQEVIDNALQIFGAAGLVVGSVTEKLYRQIRSLRIYEGTSEIQKLIIASSL